MTFLAADTRPCVLILLTSTEIYPVQYSIQIPGVDYYYSGTIAANDMVILNLPINVEVTSLDDQDKGIYVTTNSDKVTVIGQNPSSYISDSYLALPIEKFTDVVAYFYYGISVPSHVYLVYSSVLVVGTENNTMMNLISTQPTTIKVDNVTTYIIPGIQYSFIINSLQTIYIRSLDDLTGTKVVTDKPVSVFSGHECGRVPNLDVCCCSHLIEQIPPTALWGKVFYTAPLVNRSSYTIKILAAFNSTIINIYCNNTVENYAVNEGEFINKTVSLQTYCAVYSNKQILVVQFSHGGTDDIPYFGDPMMTLVPGINWYLNELDFSTVYDSNFNNFINIIVTKQYYQPNLMYLTTVSGVNVSLTTQHWEPVQVNNIDEMYVTQVNISQGKTRVLHNNPAAQMMVVVYGFSYFDGYGHLGGINLSTAAGTYINN